MSAPTRPGEAGLNVVVVRGRLSSDPRRRELPSGAVVSQLEVTVRGGGSTTSVPIALDGDVDLAAGDEVVVIGHVRRRFYRAGGATRSSTEVVAERLLRPRARRSVERALDAVAASLDRAR